MFQVKPKKNVLLKNVLILKQKCQKKGYRVVQQQNHLSVYIVVQEHNVHLATASHCSFGDLEHIKCCKSAVFK